MTIYMKSKEEIFKWHTHNLSAFSLATYKKPVYDAMQEYADQECAAKDNEISRLNGIITEQQEAVEAFLKREVKDGEMDTGAIILSDILTKIKSNIDRIKP